MKWIAEMNNGTEIIEGTLPWSDVRDDIVGLAFILDDGRRISLPRNSKYIQAKTASANMETGDVEIESRYIGCEIGNNTVIIRINEKTNNITVETI